MTSKTQQQRSTQLSYLLRHKPESANLTLDSQGWCTVLSILTNTDFTLAEIKKIVADDSKDRYSFSDETMTSIRANQGHSVPTVKITFKNVVPPVQLFHGTDTKSVGAILKSGLLPMKRHHVHLSNDLNTARAVGQRRKGGVTIFSVDAKQMLADGISFFISDNGVFLVDEVHPKYLSIQEQL
jgi:putative RNA 2'-phosphotransferase